MSCKNIVAGAVMLLLVIAGCHPRPGTPPRKEMNVFVEPVQFLIMTMKVKDYERWVKNFSRTVGKGNKYGVVPVGFARDAFRPDVVSTGSYFVDLEKAKAYCRSFQVNEEWEKSGVIGTPEIHFLYPLDGVTDATGNTKMVAVTQQVKDYHPWREKFFASEKERLMAGLKYLFILHTIDKPQEVTTIFSAFDYQIAKNFFEKDYLKNSLGDAGVEGPLQMRYFIVDLGEDAAKLNAPAEADTLSAAERFPIRLTTNVECSIFIDTVEKGVLKPGDIRKIYLPQGESKLVFKSIQNPGDKLAINYSAPEVNNADALFVDLQKVIHQRVVQEKSPKDVGAKDANNPYDMVLVKGGKFTMGFNELSMEMREHEVVLNDFYIGKYEVTQRQWREMMGTSPAHFPDCDQCPVENVSNDDAKAFIKKINLETGMSYRLPTEAEWEYAARGGANSKHYTFSGGDSLAEVAWCQLNSSNETHPVGQRKANELGLHDMSGNVFEWCSDWFDYHYYENSPPSNPQGPANGLWKVLRGGSWSHDVKENLPSYRNKDEGANRGRRTGFRLARNK